jgi:hypothetical protein
MPFHLSLLFNHVVWIADRPESGARLSHAFARRASFLTTRRVLRGAQGSNRRKLAQSLAGLRWRQLSSASCNGTAGSEAPSQVR